MTVTLQAFFIRFLHSFPAATIEKRDTRAKNCIIEVNGKTLRITHLDSTQKTDWFCSKVQAFNFVVELFLFFQSLLYPQNWLIIVKSTKTLPYQQLLINHLAHFVHTKEKPIGKTFTINIQIHQSFYLTLSLQMFNWLFRTQIDTKLITVESKSNSKYK